MIELAGVIIVCPVCQCQCPRGINEVNRAKRQGYNIYCGRVCAGVGRRANKTDQQKKEEKRIYDAEYREKNKASLKKKKAAYYKENRNPQKEAEKRKKNMARHIEYCRTPSYRKYKKQYDESYRAKKHYGEFWEVSLALNRLSQEVRDRMDFTELAKAKGTLNKHQTRRREYERLNSH